MPVSFCKLCVYSAVTWVQSFMNGERWWHMGSSAEPKIVVRKKGEDVR